MQSDSKNSRVMTGCYSRYGVCVRTKRFHAGGVHLSSRESEERREERERESRGRGVLGGRDVCIQRPGGARTPSEIRAKHFGRLQSFRAIASSSIFTPLYAIRPSRQFSLVNFARLPLDLALYSFYF